MGKIRCENCGRKVSDGFDYCPMCGSQLDHSQPREKGGCMTSLLIVLFFLMVIVGATAATVWLVRENDRELALRAEEKRQADSIKVEELRKQRIAREREDSLERAAEAEAAKQRFESQYVTIDDLLMKDGGGVRLRTVGELVTVLRECGYSTLERDEELGRVMMGLNAELRDGEIVGLGPLYAGAVVMDGGVLLTFPTTELEERFLASAKRRGFVQDGEDDYRHRSESIAISRQGELRLLLSMW